MYEEEDDTFRCNVRKSRSRDYLFIESHHTAADRTSEETWQEVIPHRQNVLLERFSLFADYLVVQDRRERLSHLRIIPWSGDAEHEIDFGESSYFVVASPTPETNTTVLRMNAGHGGASGRFEPFRLVALQYAFLLRLAGISE